MAVAVLSIAAVVSVMGGSLYIALCIDAWNSIDNKYPRLYSQVDEENREVGKETRGKCHKEGIRHRAVHVLLTRKGENGKLEVLLQVGHVWNIYTVSVVVGVIVTIEIRKGSLYSFLHMHRINEVFTEEK